MQNLSKFSWNTHKARRKRRDLCRFWHNLHLNEINLRGNLIEICIKFGRIWYKIYTRLIKFRAYLTRYVRKSFFIARARNLLSKFFVLANLLGEIWRKIYLYLRKNFCTKFIGLLKIDKIWRKICAKLVKFRKFWLKSGFKFLVQIFSLCFIVLRPIFKI